MKKIFAVLFLAIGLCLNASALNQYLSIRVTGASHATLRFSSVSNPVNVANNTDYEVYPGTSVSITVDTCVIDSTSPKPKIVLKLERVGGSGFTAIWTDTKELSSGLGLDCTVHETINLDKCFLHVENNAPCHPYDPIPPIFAPPFPDPGDEDGSGDQYWPPDRTDWTAQNHNECFPDTFAIGTQAWFPDYPDDEDVFVHVQMLPYSDNVDFDDPFYAALAYNLVMGPDAGPFDTGLANDYQTWVRSRFEHADGTPISGWSVVEVLNPLPPGPGGP